MFSVTVKFTYPMKSLDGFVDIFCETVYSGDSHKKAVAQYEKAIKNYLKECATSRVVIALVTGYYHGTEHRVTVLKETTIVVK